MITAYKPRKANFKQTKGKLNRALLPNALTYYRDICGMTLKGNGEWLVTICPFHTDTHPSFYIKKSNGAFVCHACGVKGGDIISFHQKRHGLGFVEACKALGVWEGK